MNKITEKEIEEIKKIVKKEFPEDPALQQIHIARKIIAREAEHEGLSYLEYIKSLGKQAKAGKAWCLGVFYSPFTCANAGQSPETLSLLNLSLRATPPAASRR